MSKGKRARFGAILWGLIRRLATPRHLREMLRLARGRSRPENALGFTEIHQSMLGHELVAFENPQLELYSKILPGGFLHYGYFEDVGVRPETISLDDLQQAQQRYSELVLEQIIDRQAPVLDVGAGMGGMCRMLLERGFEPVALTPDRVQVRFISATYPDVRVIEGRFHEVGWASERGRFGTVLTAESLQYLFLDNALSSIASLLRPGGRWVVCDYFRRHADAPGSGHLWDDFCEAASERGWKVTHQREITAHVAPSLTFARMLGDRFAVPILSYVTANLRRKHPAIHYLLSEVLQHAEQAVGGRVHEIDPERFVADRRYMLMVLERPEAG